MCALFGMVLKLQCFKLAPYTKNRIKYVEEKIPKQAVSYINYISTKKNPTADEQEILQRLEHLQKAIPED